MIGLHKTVLVKTINRLEFFYIQYSITMTRIPDLFSVSALSGIIPSAGILTYDENNLNSTTILPKSRINLLQVSMVEKLKVCYHFTKSFSGTGFFDKSFTEYNNQGNGYYRATCALMKNALTGRSPYIRLSYPHILISKGGLPAPMHAAAVAMKNNNIYFSFSDNSNIESASGSDIIILVAYSEKLQQAIFSLNAGTRKNCEAVLDATSLKNQTVETWMGFLSEDETHASNSVYTGRVII